MTKQVISRREFLKVTIGSTLFTTLAGAGAVTYAHLIEPYQVEVAHVSLTLPRLSPEFDGYRVVQFSDIHIGTWMTREHLEHIVDLINAESPDLVVFTGDFVTVEPVALWADWLIPPLRRLSPRDAALAILGNHDHWTNHRAVRAIIRDSGLVDVNNAVYTLQRGDSFLHIAGVDDYWERQADLPLVLKKLPADGAAILLAHEPDFADLSAAAGRFDLQLSGHSHGGQVVLPLIGPPILPTYGKKYPAGRYQIQDMLLYTNRGVGMIGPYVRFNCPPEVSVFTLSSTG